MAKNIDIGGRLHSLATEHVVAGADEILDDAIGDTQAQINKDVNDILATHSSAIGGLNSQNYVSYTATEETTAITDVLPDEGAVNTVYRLGNWNHTQYDTTQYAEYAWINTGIDQGEYVLLDVKNYGVDDEPTAGSDNLVKSRGVADYLLSAILNGYSPIIRSSEKGIIMYDGSISHSFDTQEFRIYSFNVAAYQGNRIYLSVTGLPDSVSRGRTDGFSLCRFILSDETISTIPLYEDIGNKAIANYAIDVPVNATTIQISTYTGVIALVERVNNNGYRYIEPTGATDLFAEFLKTEDNKQGINNLVKNVAKSYRTDIVEEINWQDNNFAYNANGTATIASHSSYKLGVIDVSTRIGTLLDIRSICGSSEAIEAIVAFTDNVNKILGEPIKTIEGNPVVSSVFVPNNAKYLYLSYDKSSQYPVICEQIDDVTPIIRELIESTKSFEELEITWQNNKFAEGYKSIGETLRIVDWSGDVYRLGEVDLTQLVGKTIQIKCISDTNYNVNIDSYIVDEDDVILVNHLYMNEGTPTRELVVPENASKLVLSNKYSQYPNAWVRETVYADCYKMQEDINALKPQVAENTQNIADLFEELGTLVGDGAQWHNKKWYAYGTSITETDNEWHTGKYAPYLAQFSQMILTNKGIGGGGITNYGAYSTGQVKAAVMNTTDGKLEADLITFEVGANDTPSDASLLGDVFDTTDSTFCGCLNQCIRYLLENTNAQIVVMPSVVSKTAPEDTQNYYKLLKLVKEVCYLNRVHFIDGCCGLGYARIKNGTTYTVDQIHQSELGGYILAKYMWSKIKDIPTWDLSVPN